jgi:hypothetical protein
MMLLLNYVTKLIAFRNSTTCAPPKNGWIAERRTVYSMREDGLALMAAAVERG